jgi:hypothetical protein
MNRLCPLKTVISAVLSVIYALSMCACIQPVDIDVFLDDKKVDEVIVKDKEKEEGSSTDRVIIINNTMPIEPIAAGNKRITGLNPDKYYMIELLEEDGEVVKLFYAAYIDGKGTCWEDDLGMIGRVKDGIVTGLVNQKIYRVNSASSLSPNGTNLTYFELETDTSLPAAVSGTAPVTGGKIIIPPAKAEVKQYLNVAPSLDPDKNYEVMRLPVSTAKKPWEDSRTSSWLTDTITPITTITNAAFTRPSGHSSADRGIYQFRDTVSPAYLSNASIIELPGAGETDDFVFIEQDSSGNIVYPINFRVLRVTVGEPDEPPPPNGEYTVKLTLNIADGALDITGLPATAVNLYFESAANGGAPNTVNITAAGSPSGSSIEWFYGDESLETGASISLTALLFGGNIGNKKLTLVLTTSGGVSYSRDINVSVALTGP